MIPGWIPDGITKINGTIQLKLICGADLLESFSVPGLWKEEDVCCLLCLILNLETKINFTFFFCIKD